ncbi:uncharacterized protein LOC100368070 [Saccoglossus kowalevskii]|uniref:Caldesmon-like n=1 Tax=Saccoglossus kowalevskii TaxID=10224 RepID=A0ABM0GNY5_SACKO|nr:PREDICTED: caldesmon-like [Saccoglossus kowalevskii]
MSTKPVRRVTDQLQLLERMVNKTTLATQKTRHGNIIDIGSDILENINLRAQYDKEEAVRLAVEAALAQAEQEKKEALEKARREAEEEKQRCLAKQQIEYEKMAEEVSRQRDKLEEERIEKLTRRLKKEKEEALRLQWQEAERIKKIEIKEALEKQEKKLRKQFVVEKERAVAYALHVQKQKFLKKLAEEIQKTKEECERLAAEEAERVAKIHQAEIDVLNNIILDLKRQIRDEVAARNMVQEDFRALQRDYRRFINYSDGKYHSDYMMRMKKHGMRFDVHWDRKDSSHNDIEVVPLVLHKYLTEEGRIVSELPQLYEKPRKFFEN